MVAQPRPLIEVLAEMPDFRSNQGQRHPLAAILALACSALLCGYRSYTAMAEWGRNYGARLTHALGFTRQPPCAATLHTVLKGVDRAELAAQSRRLGRGAAGGNTRFPGRRRGHRRRWQDAAGEPEAGGPWGASAVRAWGTVSASPWPNRRWRTRPTRFRWSMELLRQVVLEGRVVTMDALLTATPDCPTDRGGGGRLCDGGQSQPAPVTGRHCDRLCAPSHCGGDPHGGARRWTGATAASRSDGWRPVTCWWGYSDWPGLAQVFQLERQVISKKTGEVREEVVAGVTSLAPERADAARLLALVRGHWHIENQSHWVRDVTFDEDRSQVRCGSIPQVMAALRNTVIGLMRGRVIRILRRPAAGLRPSRY